MLFFYNRYKIINALTNSQTANQIAETDGYTATKYGVTSCQIPSQQFLCGGRSIKFLCIISFKMRNTEIYKENLKFPGEHKGHYDAKNGDSFTKNDGHKILCPNPRGFDTAAENGRSSRENAP
jgi:hypothetical protein